jgi:outer membrane protein assembly factor BamD (BamD/ComL family)
MRKVFVLIILIALAGCVPPAPKIVSGPEADYQHAALSVKEKKFHEAIGAYRKIAADAPGSDLAADSLYALALIHTRSDNPQRNYALALRSFEEFLKNAPGDRRADEVHSWVALLRMVQDLKKENETLLMNIEQLKRLDVRHEERRKGK